MVREKYQNKLPLEELLYIDRVGHRDALRWYVSVMTPFIEGDDGHESLSRPLSRRLYHSILLDSHSCLPTEQYLSLLGQAEVPLEEVVEEAERYEREGYDDLFIVIVNYLVNTNE